MPFLLHGDELHAFASSQLKHKKDTDQNEHLRCTTCHTCKNCNTQKHINAFEGKAKICIECRMKLQCATCAKLMHRHAFPSSQLKHKGDTAQNMHLHCLTCHTCKKCNTKKHIKAFDGDSPTCRQCAEGTSNPNCDACDTRKPRHAFDANIMDNAQTFRAKRIFQACYANGMSPIDVKKYRCIECGERLHLKFTEKDRRKYLTSKERCIIVYSDCYAKQKDIEKVLRQSKA